MGDGIDEGLQLLIALGQFGGPLLDRLFEPVGALGQLRLRLAQGFLRPVLLGHIANIALHRLLVRFIIDITDQFDHPGLTRFGLERQTVVTDDPVLTQLRESGAVGRFIF